MLIDCDACAVRGPACGDCVVTVLLGAPPVGHTAEVETGFDLDGQEQAAIAVLAGSGLVPPLRLVVTSSAEVGGEQNPVSEWIPDESASSENDRPDEGHRAAV
jgi:hypothetical protein